MKHRNSNTRDKLTLRNKKSPAHPANQLSELHLSFNQIKDSFFQHGTRPNFITYVTKLQSSPVHTKMKTTYYSSSNGHPDTKGLLIPTGRTEQFTEVATN
jgi:hypothetical protein